MHGAAPRVTVLMPVYNGERYLQEAIDSILCQTFTDFEFLIIDDGSTDSGSTIIASYEDERIRLVCNETNLKLIATLNRGFHLARGDYIARIDCDDMSLPERLAKQVAFLDAHPAVGVVGTWARTLGEVPERVLRYPGRHGALRCMLLFASPLAHPSVMFRRELFLRNHFFYDPGFVHAEDYELWGRVSASCELAVLEEVLLRYRVHDQQVTRVHDETVLATAAKVQLSILCQLGLEPTERQLQIHRALSTAALEPGMTLTEVDDWLCTLLRANAVTGCCPGAELTATLVDKVLTLAKKSGKIRDWWRSILTMRFLRDGSEGYPELAAFLVARARERMGFGP